MKYICMCIAMLVSTCAQSMSKQEAHIEKQTEEQDFVSVGFSSDHVSKRVVLVFLAQQGINKTATELFGSPDYPLSFDIPHVEYNSLITVIKKQIADEIEGLENAMRGGRSEGD